MNKQNHQSGHSGPDPAADNRQNILNSQDTENMFEEIASAITRGEADEYLTNVPEDIPGEADEYFANVPEDIPGEADEYFAKAPEDIPGGADEYFAKAPEDIPGGADEYFAKAQKDIPGGADEYFAKAPEDIPSGADEHFAKAPEDIPGGADEQLQEALELEEEKSRYLFEEMPVGKALAAMAVPTVISQLIVLIHNMADTFFIGRTNNPYMVAGAALILPIFNVCIAVSNIAGAGGGTLMARLMGADRPEKARRVASFSVWFSVFTGLLFAVLTGIFMHPLLTVLGASDQTYEFARQYCFTVIVIGAAPTIAAMTMGNLLRNIGCSKQAGFAISMGGVINIILDPIFMFVLLPPGNEILGAGIATTLANTITCTYFIILIIRLNNPILHFSLLEGLPEAALMASFFGVGIPAAMGPFLFDLDYIVLDRLMASHSDIALAAIGIVLKVERLPLNVGIGLCLGMVPLAAYNFSARNLPRMDAVLRAARNAGIVISIASIALYELFAPYLIRIFIGDAATVALGSDFLRIRVLATIMMFLSFIYVYFFQALGQGRIALFLVVMRWLMINIPMLFLMDLLFGLYGLAWSQLVSDVIVAFLSWLIYRSYRKKHIQPAVQ